MDALAARLPQPVRLGHRLVAVRTLSGGRVRLTFDTTGGRTVQSDHDAVVLALPFSVLRDVVFDGATALPQWKRDAIAQSGLDEAQVSNPRTGLIMGSGGGSPENLIGSADVLRERLGVEIELADAGGEGRDVVDRAVYVDAVLGVGGTR